MTEYISYGVTLTPGQKAKLAGAIKNNHGVTLRLKHSELNGGDELLLTNRQIAKLEKASINGTGAQIKIPKNRIRKIVQEGGSLWSSLFSLGSRLLPAVGKIVPALATGAASALGELGLKKIFGSGQTGGFLIPQSKIDQLIAHKNLLTRKQKEDIINALQTGGDVIIKPSRGQSGGFLGSLLAGIGIPLVMDLVKSLVGKGLHVESSRPRSSRSVYVPRGGNLWQPPPFIGSWDRKVGFGKKKRSSIRQRKVTIL